uniref:phage tail protein n=1 Tax=Siccibacter turicensis TaxID=357233 RepID=UPI003F56E7D2
KNLGLGEGSALPVGVPVPWPSATLPAGWLKYNGAAFDKTRYPKLAAVYPSGVLPDLRGEFIRGWDDGRGVDAGRELLGSQGATHVMMGDPTVTSRAIANLYNSVNDDYQYMRTALNGESVTINPAGIQVNVTTSNLDGSKFAQVTMGVRPRNISYTYIVRAA